MFIQEKVRSTRQRFGRICHPFGLMRSDISTVLPKAATASSKVLRYPASAHTPLILGYLLNAFSKTDPPATVSCMFAAWTTTVSRFPIMSVTIWCLRPLTFFPRRFRAPPMLTLFSRSVNQSVHSWAMVPAPPASAILSQEAHVSSPTARFSPRAGKTMILWCIWGNHAAIAAIGTRFYSDTAPRLRAFACCGFSNACPCFHAQTTALSGSTALLSNRFHTSQFITLYLVPILTPFLAFIEYRF